MRQYGKIIVVDHQGTSEEIQKAIQGSQGKGVINTSFIERLNTTFRSRLAALVRKGRALARTTETLHYGMYLIGTIYNNIDSYLFFDIF